MSQDRNLRLNFTWNRERVVMAGPIDVGRGIQIEIVLTGRDIRREDVEGIHDYLYLLANTFSALAAPAEKLPEVAP